MSSYQLFQRKAPRPYQAKRKLFDFSNRRLLLVLSFLLPIFLLLPAMIALEIFPFGDHTTLAVDLRNQYMGFFEAYKQAPSDLGSLLYNFTKGPGGAMVATDAYYLLSPLNLLFFAFPSAWLPLAIQIIQALKCGLAGLAMASFLIRRQHGRDYRVLLVSVSYALMSFLVANFLNLMWFDPLILLPVICTKLEEFLEGSSSLPYVLCLAFAIFTNFYMGYMLSAFLGLYAFWALVKMPRLAEEKGNLFLLRLKKYLHFLGVSVLAAGLLAFLLLPTMYSLILSKGPFSEDLAAGFELEYLPLDPLAKFVPFSFDYDQVSKGMANIYSGSLIYLLLLLYFLSQHIQRKEKLASFLVLLFLYLSMNVKFLNVLWHGMQYPIWYNYRFSWTFIFFNLLLAFRFLQRAQGISWWRWLLTLLVTGCLACYIYVRKSQEEELFHFIQLLPLVLWPLLLFLYLELLDLASKPNPRRQKRAAFFLLFLSLVEVSVNAGITLSVFNYEPYSDYRFLDRQMRQALDPIRPQKNDFYRIEKTFAHDKNDGMRFGYSSLSHFNSTYEYETVEFLSDLGFARSRASSLGFNSTKFMDAFFGIRYYLEGKYEKDSPIPGVHQLKPKSYRPDLKDMELKKDDLFLKTYENPLVLPLGMLAKDGILDLDHQNRNPIDVQENMAQLLDNKKQEVNYFRLEEELGPPTTKNLKKSKASNGLDHYEREDAKTDQASLSYKIPIQSPGSHYLTLSETLNASNSKLYLDGKAFWNLRTSNVDSSQIMNLASSKDPRQTKELEIRLDKDHSSFDINHVSLFSLDERALRDLVAYQKQNGLQLEKFSSTRITGHFTADPDHPYLLFSIPYEEGWSFKLDGNPVTSSQALGAFMAIPVSPGLHQVEAHYRPPLALPGLVLSLTSLFALFLVYRPKKKKKEAMAGSPSEGPGQAGSQNQARSEETRPSLVDGEILSVSTLPRSKEPK